MKKILLFIIIFTTIGFSQLVKPSAGGASRDSLGYVVPKTLNNNFSSNSFVAKTKNILTNSLINPLIPILFSDANYNFAFGTNNFTSLGGSYNTALKT